MLVEMTTSLSGIHDYALNPIIGREHELARLKELVDGVSARGAALLVRGEPGIGKSTLLAAAVRYAETAGVRVLRANGVQSEAHLPFAGLHQLVLPVLDRAEHLPPPQRTALFAAFGMIEKEAPDRFLIALALLELLSDVAERTPLLVVAEDAQWLDRSTIGALAFVARRVEHEPIVVLAASRDEAEGLFDGAGLPELRLGGLDEETAGALLDTCGRQLAPAVRKQLLEQSGGNPLALVELPILLGPDELGGRSLLPMPLPLTERLERAFAAHASGLPAETQTLLLTGAAADGGALAELLLAASVLEGGETTPDTLAPAVAAGLVHLDGAKLRFRHPLVRSAVYQSADGARRRASHAALAEVLAGQPDRRAWHAAAATLGPDEEVASELEQLASRAARRGATIDAVAALERAAALSDDAARRCERLLRAAELAFELGQHDLVEGLAKEAVQLAPGPHQRARLAWIRESFTDGVPGDPARVQSLLEAAKRTSLAGDTDLALKLLNGAALRCWWADPGEQARAGVVRAVEDLGIEDSDPRLIATLALAAPIQRGAQVIERLSRAPQSAIADPYASYLRGTAAHAVGDYELATRIFQDATAQLRSQGRLALLAQSLTLRAWGAIYLGNWNAARSVADEARRLAHETRQPMWTTGAKIAGALLAGVRGEEDLAERLIVEAERFTVPNRLSSLLAVGTLARGVTALGGGRYADAFEHLRRMFDPADPAYHHMDRLGGVGYLADAAVHSDNRDAALAIIGELETLEARTSSPGLRLGILYARPVLAEYDGVEALFEDALGSEPANLPFFRARLQLAYGTWLRRQRRIAESRAPLRAAREVFDALEATPWSERAHQELRAAGETGRRTPEARDEPLTPQELQIARLAASGLSNREIGQQLYLSHRTVGAHLYRAFPKLGITTRGQLRDALAHTLP
jgi:DNA-binding CsgD family transcriptional regulator/tetratricopeptide (TPR) repeat protein